MGSGSKYSLQKLNVIYRIGLKLALINGYDDKFRIRNKKGEFIANSNLLDLMHNSMTANKNLSGMEEYVELLAEANADPEWFANQIVRSNLRVLLANKSEELPADSPAPLPLSSLVPMDQPPPSIINPITSGAYWGPEKAQEKKRSLATYSKPPPLKRAPISYTPPSSPPSPFIRDDDNPPVLDRMDGPPSSPPLEMPKLKRMRADDDEDEVLAVPKKKLKTQDMKDLVNKSMQWEFPDEDKDFD